MPIIIMFFDIALFILSCSGLLILFIKNSVFNVIFINFLAFCSIIFVLKSTKDNAANDLVHLGFKLVSKCSGKFYQQICSHKLALCMRS